MGFNMDGSLYVGPGDQDFLQLAEHLRDVGVYVLPMAGPEYRFGGETTLSIRGREYIGHQAIEAYVTSLRK